MRDSIDLSHAMIDGSPYGRTELVEQPGWGALGFRQDNWKLVATKEPKLFDLSADPAEQNNLAAKYPMRVRQMTERLRKVLKEPN